MLHVMVREEQFAIAAALLEKGVNPNEVNYDNETPLHIACKEGILR